jgi:Family of unknown function (DUF6134)
MTISDLTRRGLIAGGVALGAPGVAMAARARLDFLVYRNGAKVGQHQMTFAGDVDSRIVTTQVAMTIKVGPVPVFRYRHRAVERWANGRWASLETATTQNGKTQTVTARAMPGLVLIEGPAGTVRAPAAAAPLTHWNPAVLTGPLFNPQEGKMLKVRCAQTGPGRWAIRGETEIDNAYDAAGDWMALTGKLQDGSRIEYRRV